MQASHSLVRNDPVTGFADPLLPLSVDGENCPSSPTAARVAYRLKRHRCIRLHAVETATVVADFVALSTVPDKSANVCTVSGSPCSGFVSTSPSVPRTTTPLTATPNGSQKVRALFSAMRACAASDTFHLSSKSPFGMAYVKGQVVLARGAQCSCDASSSHQRRKQLAPATQEARKRKRMDLNAQMQRPTSPVTRRMYWRLPLKGNCKSSRLIGARLIRHCLELVRGTYDPRESLVQEELPLKKYY